MVIFSSTISFSTSFRALMRWFSCTVLWVETGVSLLGCKEVESFSSGLGVSWSELVGTGSGMSLSVGEGAAAVSFVVRVS